MIRWPSSPRTRGLSVTLVTVSRVPPVVPAHAGVIRAPGPRPSRRTRRPRARGGYPQGRSRRIPIIGSSPRTRGLSADPPARQRRVRVVPAHAGVIRSRPRSSRPPTSRPRARGGYPRGPNPDVTCPESSPRTRGLSGRRDPGRPGRRVVPAHAGVIRAASHRRSQPRGRPRARGGYPTGTVPIAARMASSPRTRGLSAVRGDPDAGGRVVPAHAGVIRRSAGRRCRTSRRPRARGGYPSYLSTLAGVLLSSPRTRGLSDSDRRDRPPRAVVPAHAGVIRPVIIWSIAGWSRPRARGGYPEPSVSVGLVDGSSPRTRGLSVVALDALPRAPVVPAHAGVIRDGLLTWQTSRCRPRARGGYPYGGSLPAIGPLSSPRTRGLSDAAQPDRQVRRVVPAHAGVIRCRSRTTPRWCRRPRARGGYPRAGRRSGSRPASSPRTRGLSVGDQQHHQLPGVVPAHAGVIRT